MNKNLDPYQICYTGQSNDKFTISKLFFDSESKKRKKNRDFLNGIELNKLRSIESIREEINITETKLKPIEEEYRFKAFAKSLKIIFDSKMLCRNLTNIFITTLIVMILCLNLKIFYQKYNSFTENISYDFESPIISILPEEYEKGRIEFD